MLRQRTWRQLLTTDQVALSLAAVVMVLAAASTDNPAPGTTSRGLDGWAALLLLLTSVFVVGGRRVPGTAALAALLVSFVWYRVGYTSGLINVPTLIVFYRLGASEGRRRRLAVTAASVMMLLVGIVVLAGESLTSGLTAAGYVVMAVLFGEFIRTRELLVDHLAERAERAEAEAERRVVEERLRIARDVHDVLAHSVSAMTVQAEVAADSLHRDDEAVEAAVEAIRQTGAEAMRDVRATVTVLRSGTDGGDATPAPRIADIDQLVATAREHGLDVELDIVVSDRPLPEVVELTTFRIVQEAITNVGRHARASSAQVTVRDTGSELVVEVRDQGQAHPGPVTAGYGLRGMAERVESIGGELWHGRPAEGGWVVRASLPLPVPAR